MSAFVPYFRKPHSFIFEQVIFCLLFTHQMPHKMKFFCFAARICWAWLFETYENSIPTPSPCLATNKKENQRNWNNPSEYFDLNSNSFLDLLKIHLLYFLFGWKERTILSWFLFMSQTSLYIIDFLIYHNYFWNLAKVCSHLIWNKITHFRYVK